MTTTERSSHAVPRLGEWPCAVPRLSYSVTEAARATGLGKTTLYALMGSGELASSRIAGRRLISASDLLALLERNKTAAGALAARVT